MTLPLMALSVLLFLIAVVTFEAQVGILVEFCLPRVFEWEFVSYHIHLIFMLLIFALVAFIDKVLFHAKVFKETI